MKVDVGSVSAQLARLAGAQVKRSPAVEEHGYRLRPVVDEVTLARASRAAGIALPEEYRHFVTTVGDGGAGPYYGVLPLGAALDRLDEWYGSLDPLGRDCPLTSDISFGDVDSGTGLYCLEVDFGTFYQRWVDAEVARVTRGAPKRNARYAYLEYGDNPRYQPV